MTEQHNRPTILIIDDNQDNLTVISQCLKGEEYRFVFVQSGELALEYLDGKAADLVLLDLSMPGMTGEETLAILKQRYPTLPVIIVTASKDPDTIIHCMKSQAEDYLIKPLKPLRVLTSVKKVLEASDLRQNYESLLHNELIKPHCFTHIVTRSELMKPLLSKLEKFAMSPYPILITGDTGTGKELFAEAIHKASGKKGEFCASNVAGIDDHMFSDAMFGHEKGAFTGADIKSVGIIDKAKGGTVFMDEIGDLSPQSQIKLLRLLQNSEYTPLGGNSSQISQARIVMATNKTLQELKTDPEFRDDFYYRIAAHHVHVPSLKDRIDDVPALFEHFLNQAADELNTTVPAYSKEIIQLLQTYNFPGNVRELEHIIKSVMVSHSDSRLLVSHFENLICGGKNCESETSFLHWADAFDSLPTLKEIQHMLIEEALERSSGNASNAAKMIGITRSAMSQRLKNRSL